MKKTLIVVVGPTAVGKTVFAIDLAKHLKTEIISADSRQIYKGIPIGTATPTPEELAEVKHHFVSILPLTDHYNAGQFELDVLYLLENHLFKKLDVVIMVGGSMLYVDAVCKGIDAFPSVLPEIRKELTEEFQKEGLEYIQRKLLLFDPDYYRIVDLRNPQRILHALEICLQTGRKYSSFRSQQPKDRSFEIIKIGLELPREELYQRINQRVDGMIEKGLVEEVKSVFSFRDCNALKTVGYREIFDFLDGKTSYEEAIEKIKQHTRIYSRKQMSWFKKEPSTQWVNPLKTSCTDLAGIQV